MIVPMLVTGKERATHKTMIMRDQTTFFIVENFFPPTSSIESLVGRTQKGVAKRTTKHMPKREMYITIGV